MQPITSQEKLQTPELDLMLELSDESEKQRNSNSEPEIRENITNISKGLLHADEVADNETSNVELQHGNWLLMMVF